MGKIILIYIQMNQQKIEPVSLELIGKAVELAAAEKFKIFAAAVGSCPQETAEGLAGFPVEELYYYQAEQHEDINQKAELLSGLCTELNPDIFLIGATKEGRSLAPCIAVRLNTGLTADCTELKIAESGSLIQIRPAFEEKILAHIQTKTRPQMATVRPGIMEQAKKNGTDLPKIHVKNVEIKDIVPRYEVQDVKPQVRQSGIDITKEKLLVVLGAGVTRKEDVEIFHEWAKSMGGEIACSRKLVERGWFTVERQVGLSGNAAQAELMITVGVSGSVQFQAGIKRVKHLIAVNVDADAPIMGIADEGLQIDLEVLIRELKKRKDTAA